MNLSNARREMEFEEVAKTDELIGRISDRDNNLTSLGDLFPEFSFSGLLGLHKAFEPLPKYLVMYDRIIVNLYPTKTNDEFFNIYGLSVAELRTLLDLGKVQLGSILIKFFLIS